MFGKDPLIHFLFLVFCVLQVFKGFLQVSVVATVYDRILNQKKATPLPVLDLVIDSQTFLFLFLTCLIL